MITVETVTHFNEDPLSYGLALGFADRLRDALKDIRCSEHEEDISIRVSTQGIAQTPNDICIDVDGCCEAAIQRVRQVVEAVRSSADNVQP